MKEIRYGALIPAAGKGRRLGLGYNKAFYRFGDKTILERALDPFLNDERCREIVVVCAVNEIETARKLVKNEKITFVSGGETREESVYQGLKHITEKFVLIHDADRPFITRDLINRALSALNSGNYCVVPFVNANADLSLSGRRVGAKLIQTPQGFVTSFIREAFETAAKEKKLPNFVDDASIGEYYGNTAPYYFYGDDRNIKITAPRDLTSIGDE